MGGAAEFGTSAHQKELSLGYADVHKLQAVFESPDASTDPRLPQWTLTGSTGVFTQGEIVTGQTSGAKAFVINPQSPMTFVPIRDAVFDANEQILGLESGETATLETFSAGDKLITNHFTLDSEKKVVIEGLSHPSGATAKGSILFSCQIEHILKTQIQTDLNYFAAGYKQLLQADVVSTGCGLGESFSQEINRTNEWECLCGPRFYKPPRLECLDCPPQGLICNKIGTKIPAVAPGFWRENPLSEDFETYPLYVCTYDSCGGGNSSHNLCVDGYTGVLCATCANEYVFQFGVCTSCPGYVSDGGATTPPPQLLLAALLSLFVAVIGIYVYFTQPALKKTEIHDLRMKLSESNFF